MFVRDHDPNCSSPDEVTFQVLLARLQSTRATTRPLLPNLIVYFDLSSGVKVLSSGPWKLTNCQDVPLSAFPTPDFCTPANVCVEVKAAEAIATLANANATRIVFVFISCCLSLTSNDLLRIGDAFLPHTTHNVQHRTGSDRVRSPMAQRRVQITQTRLVEKSDEK